MEMHHKVLLGIHVACGTVSLILFWLPAVITGKGTAWHIKIGKIYMILMYTVVATAAMLSVDNAIMGYYEPAAFLGFLALITARPLWYGTAVLKYKKGQPRSFWLKQMVLRAIIIIAGIGMIVYAAVLDFANFGVLMMIFGILGISDIPSWIKEYNKPPTKVDWFKEHYSGMIVSGIAAYTAFFAFGGRRFLAGLLTDNWMVLPWVLPTILGLIAIRLLDKKYNRNKKKKVVA